MNRAGNFWNGYLGIQENFQDDWFNFTVNLLLKFPAQRSNLKFLSRDWNMRRGSNIFLRYFIQILLAELLSIFKNWFMLVKSYQHWFNTGNRFLPTLLLMKILKKWYILTGIYSMFDFIIIFKFYNPCGPEILLVFSWISV